jgi:hypothetical protein
MSVADEQPPRSPLADEAVRLLGVVQEWTRQTFPAAPQGHHEPGADSVAPVCQWCPLCQFMAVLRGERPEVTERVTEAGAALASALRAIVDAAASAAPGSETAPKQDAPRVQRIDLGGDSSRP